VRVELADHVADGARGFLGFGRGVEAQLAHGVDDAALHRLQPVAEEGQGTIEHHVHRIVEVGALGVLVQRDLFEAVEAGTCGLGHFGNGNGRKTSGDFTASARLGPGTIPA
jgi:hypothetical protein